MIHFFVFAFLVPFHTVILSQVSDVKQSHDSKKKADQMIEELFKDDFDLPVEIKCNDASKKCPHTSAFSCMECAQVSCEDCALVHVVEEGHYMKADANFRNVQI